MGVPANGITPRVQKFLLERLSQDDFRAGAASLEVLGNSISPAAAGQLQRDFGARIHEERFGSQAALNAAQAAPANPAELLIVSGDGARYRTNEADVLADTGKRRVPAANKSAEVEDRGWRKNKVGVVIRAQKGHTALDGTYHPPEELVKTYVATTADIRAFGCDLRTESERRGILTAREIVWISDHGHGLDEMREREFPEAHVLTDFFHCAERLGECARVSCGEGDAAKRPRQKLFHATHKGSQTRNCRVFRGEPAGLVLVNGIERLVHGDLILIRHVRMNRGHAMPFHSIPFARLKISHINFSLEN